MADVSTWSPIDESNTAAPPAGAPENMPTNTVNNTMRAMMGAVRRWYDTVGTQFANCLLLTGGTVTGPVSVPQLQLDNKLFAVRVGSSNLICDGDGEFALGLFGAADGQQTVYRSTWHKWQDNAGVQIAEMNATYFAHQGSFIQAASYNLGATVFATNGGGTAYTQIYDAGGGQNLTLYGAGDNYYDNNQHNFRSRGGGTAYAIFNAAGSYNVSGSWGVISDEAAKTDIAGYTRGLAAVRALRPVQYKYASGPFAGDEIRYGLIAQDIQVSVPEMVSEIDLGGERFLTMQPGHLVWVLVNACKELASRVEALETERIGD